MDMLTITNRLRASFQFPRICFFCHKSPEHAFGIINSLYLICLPCQVRYASSTRQLWLAADDHEGERNFFPVECLYSYQEAVKDCLHEAKIASSFHCVRAWQEIMAQRVNQLLQKGHVFYGVMPCPSSLWSRLRGRADLAWFLARKIHQQFRIPILSPPLSLHWRYQKQAKLKGRRGRALKNVNRLAMSYDKGSASLLILDDILTSGGTMLRLRQAVLEEHNHCFGLVLAKA